MDSTVREWLCAPDEEEGDESADRAFRRWLLSRMSANAILQAGPVLVDRAVLETRFACLSERCVPGPDRGQMRSCCADLALPLTPAERKRLSAQRGELRDWLLSREPRLRGRLDPPRSPMKSGRKAFFLDQDGTTLRRVRGRCVFSAIDHKARIRCHLYGVARRAGVSVPDLQPFSCRLFPLVLVRLSREFVLLTVVCRANYRAWQALPPWRFPCLSDPTLPPLVQSMSSTLDWLFGRGFAKRLARLSKEIEPPG